MKKLILTLAAGLFVAGFSLNILAAEEGVEECVFTQSGDDAVVTCMVKGEYPKQHVVKNCKSGDVEKTDKGDYQCKTMEKMPKQMEEMPVPVQSPPPTPAPEAK